MNIAIPILSIVAGFIVLLISMIVKMLEKDMGASLANLKNILEKEP